MKDGDLNTKFFHGKASHRRKTNTIKRLKDVDGNWRAGFGQCERILINCFAEIFKSSNLTGIEDECSVVGKEIDGEYQDLCSSPFVASEVKEDIFQMHPTKDPSSDNFPALFFRNIGTQLEKM